MPCGLSPRAANLARIEIENVVVAHQDQGAPENSKLAPTIIVATVVDA
jgi:hypothetical protein